MKLHYNIYFLLVALLSIIGTTQVNAQFKAMPDNYYIAIGGSKTLFVINNDILDDCSTNVESITLKITEDPTHGRASVKGQRISYRANPTYKGQDMLKYEINCNGTKSEATVYINIGDKPDYINEVDCTALPDAFEWRVQQVAKSRQTEGSSTTPVAGDVDEDGEIEVLTIGKDYKSVDVFSADLVFKQSFNLQQEVYLVAFPLSLARVKINGIYRTLIFVTSITRAIGISTRRVEAYSFNPQSNNYEQEWITDTSWSLTPPFSGIMAPSIADIDGDGNSEMLCGDHIYAAETGKLLVALPPGGRGSLEIDNIIIAMWADIDGDGKMEAVCGNTTYKVIINDRNDPSKNSATVLATAPNALSDGLTSVADIDGDGILDVVVSMGEGTLYVWQGHKPDVIGNRITIKSHEFGPGPVFIGDINNDDNPDICFVGEYKLYSYFYNRTTKKFEENWPALATTDRSGMTTLCLFDFNLDGRQELVYRDEDSLRIIDGITGKPIPRASFKCGSPTGLESPIIVDDGSGHAAIYVTGNPDGSAGTSPGYINKFAGTSSPTANDNNWAPARKVWNQFMYNATQVNEDLTIPRNPINRASEVFLKDGTAWHPFNNTLQQVGPADVYAKPYIDSPDLAFNVAASQKMVYNEGTDDMEVTTSIVNQGDADYDDDLKIDLFLYDTNTEQYRLVKTYTLPASSVNLPAKGSQVVSFNISTFSAVAMTVDERWTLVINGVDNSPNAPSYYFKTKECRDWNNYTQRISLVSGDQSLCEDNEIQLELSPAGVYDYYWYLADGVTPYNGKDTDNKGDSKWVKKSGNYTDVYKILIVPKGGSIINPISPIKDEITLYLSSSELVWNGNEDSNWHNVLNWTDPDDLNDERIMSRVPRSCTNVLIPRGLANYPDLTSTSTDYTKYDKAECYSIEYEHEGTTATREVAGELARPDLLTYNDVIAHLDARSNRYYGLSFPLQDMYTGDVYVTDPNPFEDGVFVYTKKYAQTNPQTGVAFDEGKWSGYFNTPDELPATGNGLGIWLDDLESAGSEPISFKFPKNDVGHYRYHAVTHLPGTYFPTPRVNNGLGKYIFTPNLDGAKVNIEVAVDSKTDGQTFLFGNPFLSHLDFDKFYQANSTLIENYYKVLNGSGVYVFDSFYLSGGTTSGNPQLTQYLAPWQSVVLTIKAGAGTVTKLKIPVDASVNYPEKGTLDGLLRNAKEEMANYMTIAIADDEVRARTLVAFKEGQSTNYNAQFDVSKTFFVPDQVSDAGTSIYTLSTEGYYIDRKGIGMLKDFEMPIGFRSKYKGTMAITFENLHEFLPEFQELYLLDKFTNKKVKLHRSHWPASYKFENDGAKAEVNDRFALIGSKEGLSIENENMEEGKLFIQFQNGRLEIQTPFNDIIQTLNIYDLSGKLIKADSNVEQTSYSTFIETQQTVYILNVKTDKQTYNQKVITTNY